MFGPLKVRHYKFCHVLYEQAEILAVTNLSTYIKYLSIRWPPQTFVQRNSKVRQW